MKLFETISRSVAKTLSWRVLLTISHTVNGYLATGSIAFGLQIAGLATIINSVLYWVHERSWNATGWSRRLSDRVFSDSHPRSLAKIASWRVLITSSNFVIPFIITGNWGQAALFTGLATVVNMVLYWSHERVWNYSTWGKTLKTT